MPKAAGELRDRIRIDRDLGVSVNVIGDAVPNWQPLPTGTPDGMIWANVAPMSAGEQWRRLQMNAEANWKVTIRYRTDVETKMRVAFGNRTLEVRGIANPDMKRRFLELVCEELVAADIGGGGLDALLLSSKAWNDPSALATMFHDAAMTTPVTANNDPVGAILDRSGNGNHLLQATANARPLYKTSGGLHWLEGDGANDHLTVSFAGTLAQPFTRVIAARFLTVAANKRLLSGKAGAPDDGQLYISDSADSLRMFAGTEFQVGFLPVAGTDYVFTEVYNGASSKFAVDNGAYVTGDAGSNGIGGFTFFANASGANPANARISGAVIVSGVASDADIALLRTYLSGKQGRAL